MKQHILVALLSSTVLAERWVAMDGNADGGVSVAGFEETPES